MSNHSTQSTSQVPRTIVAGVIGVLIIFAAGLAVLVFAHGEGQ